MDLILASTSSYRRAQVARLGLPFRSVAPPADEAALQREWAGLAPRELAERLAEAKARSVAGLEPGATVVGGDQLVALDGRILGKPGSEDAACGQLAALAGRTHHLITALAVVHAGAVHRHTEVAALTVRPLSPDAIRRYVAADRPVDCAGSYKIEERGIALFERVECADPSAIIGIPLIGLATILGRLGFAVP